MKILRSTSREYSNYIKVPRKSGKIKLKPFLVADTETIIIDNSHHVPYAVGLMVVYPGIQVRRDSLTTYFSEDYSSSVFPTFEGRSTQMLKSFIFRVATITRQNSSAKTIYFHNLGRFDGIFLLKHLALYHPNYTVKPLMRDNRLYEIAVYSKHKRLLFTFRDSLHLLPGKLDDLAKNLCPELGSKGSISYEDVRLESLSTMKESLLDYMEQDILLLGGIMQTFQDIYYKAYQADIVNKLTIASLALSLFREKYYDDNKHRIHIPNQNEDTFIRRGYYGGHTDAYIPYGKYLYYYDVNSLYPFVMKEFPMPGGRPVWHSGLETIPLDSMFGFIEAYVECPKSIKKPFLPYRNKDGTLIFPTGTFVGVYYSEELKYARDIGYTIIPICGYLFEEMESPFKGYVHSLFESRSNAKKMGNNALSYVYKILMNSLYGRFGINPQSTKTEMCNKSRRDRLLRRAEFISEVILREDLYMVSYLTNPGKGPSYWDPPKNTAVQLSAAITASARIYMYKYISREDCFYTDTDSIVLGNPLPLEDVYSSVLGKFKLEDRILEGDFLAPKCYCYTTEESEGNKKVLKFKGAGRSVITPEWYKEQYANPSRTLTEKVTFPFRPDWKELEVKNKESTTTLRTLGSTKRKSLYDEYGKCVGTEPLDINDLSCLNYIGTKLLENFKRKNAILEKENRALSQKLGQLEQERAQTTLSNNRSIPSSSDSDDDPDDGGCPNSSDSDDDPDDGGSSNAMAKEDDPLEPTPNTPIAQEKAKTTAWSAYGYLFHDKPAAQQPGVRKPRVTDEDQNNSSTTSTTLDPGGSGMGIRPGNMDFIGGHYRKEIKTDALDSTNRQGKYKNDELIGEYDPITRRIRMVRPKTQSPAAWLDHPDAYPKDRNALSRNYPEQRKESTPSDHETNPASETTTPLIGPIHR